MKKTFLDRFGPDGIFARGALLRLIPYAIGALVLLYIILRSLGGSSMASVFTFFAALCVLFSAVAMLASRRAGDAFGKLLWPTGTSTPYERDFSFEHSLVMQGRVEEALESFEALIRARPGDAETYFVAAELNATKGSPARALELFRRGRELPGVSGPRRVYATNRMIDIYRGKTTAADPEQAEREIAQLRAGTSMPRASGPRR